MAHVEPLAREQLPELEAVFAGAEAAMGFVPNSMLTMAHMPQLPLAFSLLAGAAFGADIRPQLQAFAQIAPQDPNAAQALPGELVQLIAYCVSLASGCRYCQAHTSHSGHRQGLSEDKLGDVLNFESSTLFSEAEKAVIALALAAADVPNASTQAHFEALRAHFTERQIVQIVSVISLFGFLNRWNDTMATQLEQAPVEFARAVLADGGWQVGKHSA